ncbi:hypothetical protein BIW11_02895 [Tropilaelaps mercedesae]|uniref:Uncharacterized protein n=1 Tax=Tropilaelaps mercedesae TaxID=418985 RepID=A0A1V9XVL9_9ACAR|nr:hypothetical protein BIW11_02895 [Tropilaelaps mercedesae]
MTLIRLTKYLLKITTARGHPAQKGQTRTTNAAYAIGFSLAKLC